MPYIKPEFREDIDKAVDALAHEISKTAAASKDHDNVYDGLINFAITRLLRSLYGTRYLLIERQIGLLECIKQELYRRVAAPYEDQKAIENGDVF